MGGVKTFTSFPPPPLDIVRVTSSDPSDVPSLPCCCQKKGPPLPQKLSCPKAVGGGGSAAPQPGPYAYIYMPYRPGGDPRGPPACSRLRSATGERLQCSRLGSATAKHSLFIYSVRLYYFTFLPNELIRLD